MQIRGVKDQLVTGWYQLIDWRVRWLRAGLQRQPCGHFGNFEWIGTPLEGVMVSGRVEHGVEVGGGRERERAGDKGR